MAFEDCNGKIELHSHMLEQHDKSLQQFAAIPEIIAGLKFSLDRLNATIERLEDRVQTQTQCKAIHEALEKLRNEQLMQLRGDINEMGKKHLVYDAKINALEAECNTAKGSIFLLKWSIPILVSISIAAAKFIN